MAFENIETSKKCKKCLLEKNVSNFYLYSRSRDGRKPLCKSCQSIAQKEYQATESGKNIFRKAQKKYRNTEHGKGQIKKYKMSESGKNVYRKHSQNSRIKFPEKIFARNLVKLAIAKGSLVKKPCQYPNCRHTSARIEAHHWDYSKPLDVVFFCSMHHELADKVQKLIPTLTTKV